MPKAKEIPDAINSLVRRHAVEVRHSQFGRDAEALVAKVSEALGGKSTRLNRWRAGAAAGALVAAVALFAAGWFGLQRAGLVAWAPWTLQRGADNAKAAAEAEARRKSEEARQQRLAAARAAEEEEERKAKEMVEAEARRSEEAEQQRLPAVRADDERKNDEAEQQRLAFFKAQGERKAREAADARARYSVLVSQGNVDSHNGAYDRAIATFSEAIRIDVTSAVAFNNRGAAYAKKGDNDRAIADYTEAIRLDPRSAFAFYNRGLAYAKKGDGNRAISDYSEAIRLDPRSAGAFYDRGLAYAKKSDNDRAIADYSEAIRTRPQERQRLEQPRLPLRDKRRQQPRNCRLQRGDPTRSRCRSLFLQSRTGEGENQGSERSSGCRKSQAAGCFGLPMKNSQLIGCSIFASTAASASDGRHTGAQSTIL